MASPDTTQISDLRDAIEFAGLTQRSIARSIGVDETQVSRWCNGLRIPDRQMAKLAEALKLREGEDG